MKTVLKSLSLLAFVIFSISSVHAAEVPETTLTGSGPLKKQYLNYRYQMLPCAGTLYLDMEDVSMVKKDDTSMTAHLLLAGSQYPGDWEALKHVWWLYMKNGKVHYCGGHTEPETAFKNYVTFLRNHPEFSTLH